MSVNLTIYLAMEKSQQQIKYVYQSQNVLPQVLPVTPRVSEAFGKWIPIYLQASNLQSTKKSY